MSRLIGLVRRNYESHAVGSRPASGLAQLACSEQAWFKGRHAVAIRTIAAAAVLASVAGCAPDLKRATDDGAQGATAGNAGRANQSSANMGGKSSSGGGAAGSPQNSGAATSVGGSSNPISFGGASGDGGTTPFFNGGATNGSTPPTTQPPASGGGLSAGGAGGATPSTGAGGVTATGGSNTTATGGAATGGSVAVIVGATIGTVGDACAPNGSYGCAAHAQRNRLVCTNGQWTSNGSCSTTEACDTSTQNAGLCMPIVAACSGKQPGIKACNGQQVVECGPDLVTATVTSTCSQKACVNAACVGNCEPGQKRCASGAASVETCTASGTWSAVACADATPLCSNATCVAPPSCNGSSVTCGTSSESCCTSSLIPGGTFKRNYDGITATDGSKFATVASFRLDKFEVTVARFRMFLAAWNAGYRPAAGAGKHVHLNGGKGLVDQDDAAKYEPGWIASDWNAAASSADYQRQNEATTYTAEPGTSDTLPMNYVTWWEAYAFCIWDGGFLPSDAELNYAASGGDQQRVYPWSSPASTETLDCRHSNFNLGTSPCYGNLDGQALAVAVGTLVGFGRWGHADLSGNVEEFALDREPSALPANCNNCTALATNSMYRVKRGGAMTSEDSKVRSSSHWIWQAAGWRMVESGFRCARVP